MPVYDATQGDWSADSRQNGGALNDNQIRSVARALAVLRMMNTAQRWTIHELHAGLGLPKTTLFRILATLQTEGYVQADVARGQYTLTRKVGELGGGYTEQAEIISAGSPIALRVTKEIKWPLAIGVRDAAMLVIGFSTMPYSPVAVHTTTIGHHLRLDNSAMGLAYLAHCSAQERTIVEELLGLSAPQGDALPPPVLMSRLRDVLAQGYAVRQPVKANDSATLAVPIFRDGLAIAALGMTTFGRLMNQRMVEQYFPILRATASDMTRQLSN
jgi:IclR family mhp operon transcriptional activator